jgi:hypothetical protein
MREDSHRDAGFEDCNEHAVEANGRGLSKDPTARWRQRFFVGPDRRPTDILSAVVPQIGVGIVQGLIARRSRTMKRETHQTGNPVAARSARAWQDDAHNAISQSLLALCPRGGLPAAFPDRSVPKDPHAIMVEIRNRCPGAWQPIACQVIGQRQPALGELSEVGLAQAIVSANSRAASAAGLFAIGHGDQSSKRSRTSGMSRQ